MVLVFILDLRELSCDSEDLDGVLVKLDLLHDVAEGGQPLLLVIVWSIRRLQIPRCGA
jgi:hypothetical protein